MRNEEEMNKERRVKKIRMGQKCYDGRSNL
jgi:hypothetical protein